MTFRFDIWLFFLLLIAICLCDNLLGQVTPKEIYRLDPFALELDGDSDRMVAMYIISLSLQEQERLQNEIARSRLDEAGVQRLRYLEEALSPINSCHEAIKNGQIPTWDLRQMEEDMEIATLACAAIGEEEMLRLVSTRVLLSLTNKMEQKKNNAYTPSNLYAMDIVKKLLSLTNQQIDEIESNQKAATEKLKRGSEVEFKKLDMLINEHWQNLLFELDTQQQADAKRLIGEPIQWFRNASSQTFRARDFSLSNFQVTPGGKLSVKTDDGRSIFQMSPEELESHGIEFFSSLAFQMFEDPFVWDELELTPDQRKEIKSKQWKDVFADSRFNNVRLTELLGDDVKFPKSIKTVLTKDQLTWFRHMELQIFTGKYESSVSLLHPRVKEKLQLSPVQSSKIQQLADDYSKTANELSKIIKEDRERIQKEFVESVEKLLTQEQIAKFQKLTGKKSEQNE